MNYTINKYKKELMHEIDSLKDNCTDEEKDKLNYAQFSPNFVRECIYGQLTGTCDTPRAKELMELGCKRVFHIKDADLDSSTNLRNGSFKTISELINGKPNYNIMWEKDSRTYAYYSLLEGYIFHKDADVSKIINYIKGNSNTLELVISKTAKI